MKPGQIATATFWRDSSARPVRQRRSWRTRPTNGSAWSRASASATALASTSIAGAMSKASHAARFRTRPPTPKRSIASWPMSAAAIWSARRGNSRRAHSTWRDRANEIDAAFGLDPAAARDLDHRLARDRRALVARAECRGAGAGRRSALGRAHVYSQRHAVARLCRVRDCDGARNRHWPSDGPQRDLRLARGSMACRAAQFAGAGHYRTRLYLGRIDRHRRDRRGGFEQTAGDYRHHTRGGAGARSDAR